MEQLAVEAQDWQAVAFRLAREKAATEAAYERLLRRLQELEQQIATLDGE